MRLKGKAALMTQLYEALKRGELVIDDLDKLAVADGLRKLLTQKHDEAFVSLCFPNGVGEVAAPQLKLVPPQP